MAGGINPLVESLTDSYCDKNINHYKNSDKSNGVNISNRVNNKGLYADRLSSTDVKPLTNPNNTKSETCSDHCNINDRVDNKIPWPDILLLPNPNYIKIEIPSNYYNMSDIVSKEILFTEKRQPNHSNPTYFRSKYLANNIINNNHNVDNRLNNKAF